MGAGLLRGHPCPIAENTHFDQLIGLVSINMVEVSSFFAIYVDTEFNKVRFTENMYDPVYSVA